MGRNKVIYGLAEFALVVSSEVQTGGTWAGASEALKAGWRSLFVRDAPDAPEGNRRLIKLGGVPFPAEQLDAIEHLGKWLERHVKKPEPDLFSFPRQGK